MAEMTPEPGGPELADTAPDGPVPGGPAPSGSARSGSAPDDLARGGPGPDGSATGGSDTAGGEGADALPSELIPSGFDDSYRFPDNSRRRVAGGLYVALGAAAVVAAVVLDGSVLVNSGFVAGAVALILIGLYYIQAGQPLSVDEGGALVAAVRAVGFPVGHASARLGWRGLRSRPTWRVLLYSNDTPPARRGIVLVDGLDGGIVAHFTEDNPEDWSDIIEDAAGDTATEGEIADSAAAGGVPADDDIADGAGAAEGVTADEAAEDSGRSDSGP